MKEYFISEMIKPLPGELDAGRAAAGEPALPLAFQWRGETVRVASVVRTWKESGPCTHGSGERYVRKHWYEVSTDDGRMMVLYFDRKSASPHSRMKRWWLFSLRAPQEQRGKAP